MTPRCSTLPALLVSALAAGAAAPALAQQDPQQEPTPPPAAPASLEPKITGFVDVTYNYNLSRPMNGVNQFHAYTSQHNTFLLNAAHIAVGASNDTITYNVEVDAGSDAIVNSYLAPTPAVPAQVDVQEAFVQYTSPKGFGIKAGKFVTYEGIEVIESGSNPTISRGHLFGLAEPIFHVGALLLYKFSPTLDGAIGVVNGWDVLRDNNRGKTFIAKVGYTGEGKLLTVSGIAGPEQPGNDDDWRFSGDATGMVKLGTIDLWFQVNAGTEQVEGDSVTWLGGGLQPLWHVSDDFALGLRGEVFDDSDGARTAIEGGHTVFNVTATPAYTLTKGLVLRTELSVDVASEDVFQDSDGGATSSQVIALGEAIYSF